VIAQVKIYKKTIIKQTMWPYREAGYFRCWITLNSKKKERKDNKKTRSV